MRSNRAGYPLYAAVNITTRCNMDCIYCYLRPRSGLDISFDDFTKVLDDLSANRIFFVHLSGGEPFLHPDFVRIVDYACRKIADVSILTNGTVVGADHLDFFRDITRRTPVKIQVSLDSTRPEINRLTRKVDTQPILRNIGRLADSGVLLAAGMVVTRHNAGTLVESILELKENIRFFHIMCVQATESDPGLEDSLKPDGAELAALWHDLELIRDEYGLDISKPPDFMLSNYKGCAYGAPCAAAFSYVVVDPDLNVRPCDKINSIVLGNMKARNLRDVWNGDEARRFIDNDVPLCTSRGGRAPVDRATPANEGVPARVRLTGNPAAANARFRGPRSL